MHARRTYSRLFPNHTRAGTRWSSFLYEKGSPRGNLARVLVVHLVEGGSSTTGEQTNCDLTRYVKKRGKHVGPVLGCVASTRTTRRSLILLHAFSLTHACGCSQTRTGFCLVLLLQQAIRPARGGRTCSSGFDTVEAVVVTSLFVFSKRRRAKRNLNMAVANIGARI